MLELIINGQNADIKDTSIIAVTKTYESATNPLNYYADYSKTIKLPISPRNNAIFNNFNRLDNIVTNTTIDPVKKIPFMLLNNQEPVMEGYLKLENANTIYTDECYEVTLFSSFGLIMNELKLLTFNPNAQDIDPKYIIDSPFSGDVMIDRNLVKQSFEQSTHNINGNSVIDWIGFIPTYQGMYTDFSSDRVQLLPSGKTEDMSRERDEHYTREFRSYYQQPFIWVDKLWKVAKEKIEEISDYTMVLDKSWFIANNPYYADLLYTCPSLFNTDNSDFVEKTQVFQSKLSELAIHWYSRSGSTPLNSHVTHPFSDLTSTSGEIYADGIFNADSDKGTTVFKASFKMTLFAYASVVQGTYAKITDDNPLYIRFKAVNADTNEDIFGANKTFLVYSDDHDANTTTYDESVNLGISERGDFPSTMAQRSPSYEPSDGYVWDKNLSVELNVNENVPYRIVVEAWFLNNDKPFEWVNTSPTFTPTWDWLWTDFFTAETGKGCTVWFDTLSASVETTNYNRSGSNITLYKIFPKETTICDVLLNYSKMFGLMWKIDETEKTITVMTRDKFFENYHIEDWSDKIDRSKEFKFNPLTFDKRYVEFNFEEGEAHRLKHYEDLYQLTYGTKKLDSGYEFNADTNKLFEKLTPSVIAQKRQFSKMMNTEYENRPHFMGYSYMVYPKEHFVDNDNNGESAGMSGAFYFKNGTFAPDSELSNWDSQGNYVYTISDDTEHMIKSQEFCWNNSGENISLAYSFPDISTISKDYGGYNYSIHFAAPKEYYFDSEGIGDIKYIYDTFWKDYINERYCSQNKKLTAYVYLSIDEFQKMDFTGFVNIDNILYHVDKIYDYNFNSDAPVKMDLAQVWDLSAYLGHGSPFPYIYTDYTQYTVQNSAITVPVHASGEWTATVISFTQWLTATRNGSDLILQATSQAEAMRTAVVMLRLDGGVLWALRVTQVPVQGRLNVTPETLVFSSNGGTQEVLIDSSNLENGAISIAKNARWVSARIREYNEGTMASRRSYLHLEVTASPCTATISRNAAIILTMEEQGVTYTATVNVGQQAGEVHRMDENTDVIEDIEDFAIRDSQGSRVYSLIAGQQYTFEDYFPEEIDINSIQISNGFVNISGSSGLQTITFTPQLSDGSEAGGGVITITTLNGGRITYPYNVTATEPAPAKRRVIVSSDGSNGLFTISADGMESRTTDYFDGNFNDGAVVKLTAVPKDGYTISRWVRGDGYIYTTQQITITVGSGIVGTDGNITVRMECKEAQKTATITLVSSSDGYITIGSDTTPYSRVSRTMAVGSTLTNVTVHANTQVRPFKNWSDGSTANPRDIIVNRDITLSAVYGGQQTEEATVILDGGGISGGDDTVLLNLNGEEVMRCGAGVTENKNLPVGDYQLDLVCEMNNLESKFNNFTINGIDYYTNPYIDNEFSLQDKVYISVLTIPSGVYYTEGNFMDTIKGNSQAELLDGQFSMERIEAEVKVPTNRVPELTVAIPSDYIIAKVLNENGDDVMEYFEINTTENGNWTILYTDMSGNEDSFDFVLEF